MAESAANDRPFARRSPVHRCLVVAGARFGDRAGRRVVTNFERSDPMALDRLALADLSTHRRVGWRGVGSIPFFASAGLDVPIEANRAAEQADGTAVLRLGARELLVLAPLAGDGPDWQRQVGAAPPPNCFRAPAEDGLAWFRLTGRDVPAFFAHLAAVDFRPDRFPVGAVAQTRFAHLSAILTRRPDAAATPVFDLLADSASAVYLWDTLVHTALHARHGRAFTLAGLDDLDQW